MKTLVLIALLSFLVGCTTCRVTSIDDARYYQSQGYPTRIAVYKVGLDGRIMGMGQWDYHAQAQVRVDGEWKWINGGINDSPAYSIDGDIHYWQPEIYEAYLKQKGAYN